MYLFELVADDLCGRICWRVAVVPGLFLAGYAAVKAMV